MGFEVGFMSRTDLQEDDFDIHLHSKSNQADRYDHIILLSHSSNQKVNEDLVQEWFRACNPKLVQAFFLVLTSEVEDQGLVGFAIFKTQNLIDKCICCHLQIVVGFLPVILCGDERF